jgi:hypothetical protein
MRITKFKIIPKNPEDETFHLTREIKTIMISSITHETDEFGNIISARERPVVNPPVNKVEEVLTAVGTSSGQKAQVIVLETDSGPTEEGLSELNNESARAKPVSLNSIMNSGIRKINPDSLF